MPKCPTCNDKRSVWDNQSYVPCPSCNSDGTVDTSPGESIEPSKGSAHPDDAEESLEVEGYEPIPGK
jgi:DnaJ-class molecular chaperone